MIEYAITMWNLAANGNKQGVCFFASIYAFLIVGYSVIFQLRVRAWPSTVGELIDAQIQLMTSSAHRSEQTYSASALYTYRVGANKYDGRKVSTWVVMASRNVRGILQMQLDHIQKVGADGVIVFYNPKKPAKSVLMKPGMAGVVLTFAIAVVPVMVYYHAYHV